MTLGIAGGDFVMACAQCKIETKEKEAAIAHLVDKHGYKRSDAEGIMESDK